jgi:hypothetical protein
MGEWELGSGSTILPFSHSPTRQPGGVHQLELAEVVDAAGGGEGGEGGVEEAGGGKEADRDSLSAGAVQEQADALLPDQRVARDGVEDVAAPRGLQDGGGEAVVEFGEGGSGVVDRVQGGEGDPAGAEFSGGGVPLRAQEDARSGFQGLERRQ